MPPDAPKPFTLSLPNPAVTARLAVANYTTSATCSLQAGLYADVALQRSLGPGRVTTFTFTPDKPCGRRHRGSEGLSGVKVNVFFAARPEGSV